jgi:GTP cyclohydrolase I
VSPKRRVEAAARGGAQRRTPDARGPDATRGPGPARGPDVFALTTFLRSLGIDPRRDSEYTVTAELTAALLAERTNGLREEPRPIRPSRYRGRAGELVKLDRIPVYGMCPHHLIPYFGYVSVTYAPRETICGIGSLARLVRDLSCCPRLQEDLTQAIADCVERDLEPASVEVIVRARHLCLEMRGVGQRALFVTEARRGSSAAGGNTARRKTRRVATPVGGQPKRGRGTVSTPRHPRARR